MDHPLDFIDFDEVIQHGDPGKWKSIGVKPGSGVPAHSPSAPPGTTKHYDIYEDEFGDEIEVHYLSSPGWIGQRCQGKAPKLGEPMPTTPTNELLRRLRVGNCDPADSLYLVQVKADDLIGELAAGHPIRFQERRLKEKWEIGLARSVQHRLVFRRLRSSPFLVAEVQPVLQQCLMLSGEGAAVTGWSFTPQIQVRRGSGVPRSITLITAAGFKLDHFPDGWEVKRLTRKKVQLTEDFLRQRGWQFDALLPTFSTLGQAPQP